MTTRIIEKDGKTFTLVFDDELILDTVHVKYKRRAEPTQLNGSNRNVQFFVRHQDKLSRGIEVDGVKYLNSAPTYSHGNMVSV